MTTLCQGVARAEVGVNNRAYTETYYVQPTLVLFQIMLTTHTDYGLNDGPDMASLALPDIRAQERSNDKSMKFLM